MDLAIGGKARDEIARILEQVAAEGLAHPRNLDSAIDAIGTALQGVTLQQVAVDGQVYYIPEDEDPATAFGEEAVAVKGHFIPGDSE